MPRNHARQSFRELMRALFEAQESAWSMEQPNRQGEVPHYQIIYQNRWRLLDFKEFDWEDDVAFAPRRCVMLLPPLEKDGHLYPVMSIEYSPGDDFERSSLHIHVLLLKGWDEEKLLGFAFRIDSPHAYAHQDGAGTDRIGRHDFYHAQLVMGVGYGAKLDLPDWWPCTQPSFPLWAVNPVDAVLNLILTLYGSRYYRHFLSSHGRGFLGGISEEFKTFNKRLGDGER